MTMWDEEQDGTEADYAYRAKLVDELERRCYWMLDSNCDLIDATYGLTKVRRCIVGPVEIKCVIMAPESRKLWVDVFDDGIQRAYTVDISDSYIDRKLVVDIVLPTLRRAMILDDIIDQSRVEPD